MSEETKKEEKMHKSMKDIVADSLSKSTARVPGMRPKKVIMRPLSVVQAQRRAQAAQSQAAGIKKSEPERLKDARSEYKKEAQSPKVAEKQKVAELKAKYSEKVAPSMEARVKERYNLSKAGMLEPKPEPSPKAESKPESSDKKTKPLKPASYVPDVIDYSKFPEPKREPAWKRKMSERTKSEAISFHSKMQAQKRGMGKSDPMEKMDGDYGMPMDQGMDMGDDLAMSKKREDLINRARDVLKKKS